MRCSRLGLVISPTSTSLRRLKKFGCNCAVLATNPGTYSETKLVRKRLATNAKGAAKRNLAIISATCQWNNDGRSSEQRRRMSSHF
jgi:hypothetical protein